MSTTTQIQISPTGLNPTYNETIIVLSSPNIISDNFKWIVELYKGEVGDIEYELISTLTILPNPDGYGVIDVHRHIENYITTSFYPADVDRISGRVFNEGLKWSIEIKEVFENPRWRFDDNDYYAAYAPNTLGFTTLGYTDTKHPFIVGDVIDILQDPGATNPSYDGQWTIVATPDEYTIVVDTAFGIASPPNPGLASLSAGGTRTLVQDLTGVTNTFYSFNGVLSFQDFRNWDSSDYLMNASSPTSTKFLLDGPREFDVTLEDRVWINSYMDFSPPPWIQIETDNGVFIASQIYIPTEQHFINQNKVGVKDILETTDIISVIAGSLPVVDSNTTFVKINFDQGLGIPATKISETITLNVVDECSKYDKIRFFYMDKLGSYLPLTFNKVSKKNKGVKRSNYSQNYGRYDSVANEWGYTTSDKGTTNYDMVITESVTCTSDWLTDEMASMVIDMLESPNVYVLNDAGEYISVNITTNTYEEKKRQNDKLINYVITFEYSNKNKSQRG